VVDAQAQLGNETSWDTPLERGENIGGARENPPRACRFNNGDVVVAYDLPSEHLTALRDDDNRKKVRALRLRCVYRLHNLGLQTTESVILVPRSRTDRIEGVVRYVYSEYEALESELRDQGVGVELVPLIEVIPITQAQVSRFRILAERRLRNVLDSSIDNICRLLEQIEEIAERERRRRLRYRLNRLNVEFSSVEEAAQELGIDLSRDFDYLFDLLNTAIRRLEREG